MAYGCELLISASGIVILAISVIMSMLTLIKKEK